MVEPSDNNQEQKSSEEIDVKNVLEQNRLNAVFYEDSFAKTSFFTKIIPDWNIPIFYFDFDLLYSGFVKAETISCPKNVTIISPDSASLRDTLKSVIQKISETKSLVIIDSLNGFYNMFDEEKDVGRLINSIIMMLTSSTKISKSLIIIACLSKLNDENNWVLYSTGRHMIDSEHMTKIRLDKLNSIVTASILNADNSKKIQASF